MTHSLTYSVGPSKQVYSVYCCYYAVKHMMFTIILILSSITSKPYLLLMAFTLFVTLTKDHNNHDNLIFRHRGCSRARYKETINEYGMDKQLDTERGRVGL